MAGLSRDVLDQLTRLLRPLATRVANTVARGVVQLVDDSTKMQLLQVGVLDTEDIDGAEHFQPYGISSVPPVGAEVIVVFPNGDRGHPLAFAVADRNSRPTGGQSGEFVVYTDEGDTIRLGRGHVITLTSSTVKLGSSSASIPPALATELADLKARIAAWAPVPNDGGASLKAVFAAWPAPGATKVKVE